MANPSSLAYLTPELLGTGGVLKERPEDFLVEEQALYEPAGRGEHLYLLIEKKQRTTAEVARHLARAFHVRRSDVGVAGLKDKAAITRQHFSIYLPDASRDAEGLARIDAPSIKLLWAARHGNKLRRGHLAGNRFVIRVRGVEPASVVRAKRILDRLSTAGAPNYAGEQRFGQRGDNAALGGLLLRGQWEAFLDLFLGHTRNAEPDAAGREAYARRDFAAALDAWPRYQRPERQALDALRRGRDPGAAVLALDAAHREFLIHAWQSEVFNRVLDRRLREGCFDRLVPGDLAWKHDSGAVFAVDGATAEAENAPAGRVASLAVSPSGPLWGTRMTRATGDVAAWETEALAASGVAEPDLTGGPQGHAEGARRPLRVILKDAEVAGGVDEHGPYVRVAFELAPGGFATAVLREIMKVDPAAHEADPEEQA